MKHVFLINSFTVRCVSKFKKYIKNYCNENNIDYVIEVNSIKKSTESILNKYKNGKHIIFAVGGDGVINRVLNSIIGTKNILSFIPFGTGNDLNRSIRDFDNNRVYDIDTIKINDKFFINVACFGIDSDIGNNKKSYSNVLFKKSAYIRSLVSNFFKYRNRKFKVYYDNKVLIDKFVTIAVCNGSYYGGGFKISPSAILNDGLFNVYMLGNMDKFNTLMLLSGMKKGIHEKDNRVIKYSGKKIRIESDELVKCNIDGEILEDRVFNINLVSNGIKFIMNHNLVKYVLDNVNK